MAQIEAIARRTPGVAHTITISGMSFVLQANSSNFGSMFVVLEPFDEAAQPRPDRHRDHGPAAGGLGPRDQGRPGGRLRGAADPGPERRRRLQAHGRGPRRPRAWRPCSSRPTNWSASCRRNPGLIGVVHPVPLQHAAALHGHRPHQGRLAGRLAADVNQTLEIYLGSLYVNSFNEFGRYWQVTVQAEGQVPQPGRGHQPAPGAQPVGADGPLGTLVNLREVGGPVYVTRYNLYTAAPITGNLRPGVSSGDAIARRSTAWPARHCRCR